jgi:hypothetical protein
MDQLDDLLAASSPRVAPSREVDRVTTHVTRKRRRRGLVIAGLVTLSLGTATAAIATDLPIDAIINYYLNGHQNDHAWAMDITGDDGTFYCMGGIVVLPDTSRAEYNEADYLAAKAFIQNQDWSDLKPDPSLLHERERGTAEQLAMTVDRSMSQTALLESGLPLTSIHVQGTAQCEPK